MNFENTFLRGDLWIKNVNYSLGIFWAYKNSLRAVLRLSVIGDLSAIYTRARGRGDNAFVMSQVMMHDFFFYDVYIYRIEELVVTSIQGKSSFWDSQPSIYIALH